MGAAVDVPLRRLVHEYAFDARLSNCSSCSLISKRDETYCPSQRPDIFNGLMIVGEGPGATEAKLKKPFVGRVGHLLDKMLVEVGIDRGLTYLSNSTSCLPPFGSKEKDAALDVAVPACRPRLAAEIEHYRPRVIVALGGEALASLAGRFETFTRRLPKYKLADGTPTTCPQCTGQMTLAWWKCAQKHVNLLPHSWDAHCGKEIDGEFWCRECYERPDVLKQPYTKIIVEKRKKQCPTCLGRKTVEVEQQEWTCEHKISKVAGLLFRGRLAADYDAMDPEARIDLPVHYVIPTWHPSFLLRQPDKKEQKKTPGGQFLLNAALDHLRKAKRLLTENAKWAYRYHVVPDHLVRDVAHLADTDPTRLLAVAQADATAIAQLREYVYGNFGQIATTIDLETDNKEPWSVTDIRCIGFHHVMPTDATTQAMPALVVNTAGRKRGDPLIEEICAWLANAAHTKAGQNGASYEVQVVWFIWKIDIEGYKLDTLVAHNVVRPDEPHDLQHIAGCYTDTPPWKPIKKKNDELQWESGEQLHRYNGRDVYNTSLAIREQLAELDRDRVPSGRSSRFIHDLDVAMFRVTRDMERGGMPVCPERWRKWEQRADFYMERDGRMLSSLIGKPIGKDPDKGEFNPNASAQVQWFLYDKAGPCRLTPTKYTDTGQPSADKSALAVYQGHPAVDLLLDYRRWMHTRGTFMGGMSINVNTWRLFIRWNPLGAVSGRFTSSPNGQNWGKEFTLCNGLFEGITAEGRPYGGPHRLEMFPGDYEYLKQEDKTTAKIPGIREVIKTPAGRKVVGADLAQAELRALGALSGDKKLISLCVNADENRKLEPEWDPHAYGCSFAFKDGYTGTNVSETVKKRLRDLFKRVIYGSFYGAGADTILESIYDGGYEGAPIDIATVETILKAIFVAFPDVRPWRENMLREAQKTGKIWDALIGRRREFPMLIIEAPTVFNFALQCCRSGTRVLTKTGYQRIERASCLASIGAPGHWSTSMTIGKRREQIWRTELESGHVLETNAEHYLKVLRGDRSGFDWKAVGELQSGDSIAQPLAVPQEFGSVFDRADAYWLGYYIGNGFWSGKQVAWCFGTRVGRFSHDQYAASFETWAQQYGGTWKPQVDNALTTTSLAMDNGLRDFLPLWGVDPEWRAKTKRVPEVIWRASLEARKSFLLGYMDADGTLSQSMPAGHTPNLELLRDLQMLARTCGVSSQIYGPYVVDQKGHEAWLWTLPKTLMRAHLGYALPSDPAADRLRYGREERLADDARDRFLETYPKNPFSYLKRARGADDNEYSFYVLYSRLACGGTTNPQTLQRMYEAAGDARDPSLYTTGIVKSVTPLEVEDDLFTLAVEHENHCYDSAGVVSKNSTVGSMMSLALWELHKQLPHVDPTATILAQVHDAIYVECNEDKAHLVAKLLEQCMSGEYRFVQGADFMPFPATAKIADDWLSAG